MSSPESIQPEYINTDICHLTKEALLWERSRGVQLIGESKFISVRMPVKLGGQLALWATLRGNYQTDFEVMGVTLERGTGNDRMKMDFSMDHAEAYDYFTSDFIDSLANYDKHDHNICDQKFVRRSRWANTFIEGPQTIAMTDAGAVKYKDQDPIFIPPAFADRQQSRKVS